MLCKELHIFYVYNLMSLDLGKHTPISSPQAINMSENSQIVYLIICFCVFGGLFVCLLVERTQHEICPFKKFQMHNTILLAVIVKERSSRTYSPGIAET